MTFHTVCAVGGISNCISTSSQEAVRKLEQGPAHFLGGGRAGVSCATDADEGQGGDEEPDEGIKLRPRPDEVACKHVGNGEIEEGTRLLPRRRSQNFR